MPIIRVETGDLLKKFENNEFFGVVHGCNCFHYMHAGIAGQLAKRYPEVRESDKETLVGDYKKLGTMSVASTKFGMIYNMYTQYKPGVENPDDLYKNIGFGFHNLNLLHMIRKKLNITENNEIVGIPRIGAGIAGGDWKVIEKIINDKTPDIDIVLVDYKPESMDLFSVAAHLGFMS